MQRMAALAGVKAALARQDVAAMLPPMNARIALLAASLLLAAGCVTARNKWVPPSADKPAAVTTAPAETSSSRIVLFARVDTGPLVKVYPAADVEYAYQMATYIDVLARDADGQVGESIPTSSDEIWTRGRVPTAGGAHLVVLTRVLEFTRVPGIADSHGSNEQVRALVEVRCVDADGRIVLVRKVSGLAPVARSAKYAGPENEPQSLATWQALSTACGLVKAWLDGQPDLSPAPRQSGAGTGDVVEVSFDSEPAKADILVDGVFKGTTPQSIPLAPKPLTIRIERVGYKPWTREVTPVPGMRIQPALEKQ